MIYIKDMNTLFHEVLCDDCTVHSTRMSSDDVTSAMKKLKPGKSDGYDGLSSDYYCNDPFIITLYFCYVQLYDYTLLILGQNPPRQNHPGQNSPGQNPPGQNPPGQNPPGQPPPPPRQTNSKSILNYYYYYYRISLQTLQMMLSSVNDPIIL